MTAAHAHRNDWLWGAAIAAALEAEVVADHRRVGSMVVATALVALLGGATGARRAYPFSSTCLVATLLVLLATEIANLTDLNTPMVLLVLAPYTVAAYAHRVASVVGLAACLAAPPVCAAVTTHARSSSFALVVVAAAWLVGAALRRRRVQASELRGHAIIIESEREAMRRLALIEERSRIAAELQQVVAASVAVIVQDADHAEALFATDIARADDVLGRVEQTARQTLAEIRLVLGALREDGGALDAQPRPGIGQIHALVEHARGVRRAHRQITIRVDGEPTSVPAGTDVATYRIVEQALLGTTRHDGALSITLGIAPEQVRVVIDRERPMAHPWPTPAMQEWIDFGHGDTDATDRRSVAVRLPIDTEQQ